jgi:hypothetical protein
MERKKRNKEGIEAVLEIKLLRFFGILLWRDKLFESWYIKV